MAEPHQFRARVDSWIPQGRGSNRPRPGHSAWFPEAAATIFHLLPILKVLLINSKIQIVLSPYDGRILCHPKETWDKDLSFFKISFFIHVYVLKNSFTLSVPFCCFYYRGLSYRIFDEIFKDVGFMTAWLYCGIISRMKLIWGTDRSRV